MPSSCMQDKFVVNTLNSLTNGFYVDIGCYKPTIGNNTEILEKSFGWSGISIDVDQDAINEWQGVRNTDKVFCLDALKIDYLTFFEANNVPKLVDYLSLDLEPPDKTFDILSLIPWDKYKFKVITFEHDDYREEYKKFQFKQRSRDLFSSLGYKLVSESMTNNFFYGVSNSEDWYVL